MALDVTSMFADPGAETMSRFTKVGLIASAVGYAICNAAKIVFRMLLSRIISCIFSPDVLATHLQQNRSGPIVPGTREAFLARPPRRRAPLPTDGTYHRQIHPLARGVT